MTPTAGQFLLRREDGTNLVGQWSLTEDSDDVGVEINGRQYTIRCDRNLQTATRQFVRVLEKRILKQSLELVACCGCPHYQLSGMAIDMGRAHVGNCILHKTGVRTLHSCGDFNSNLPNADDT